MSKIRVLPTALKNKIAAGEVVERPASVVRELIENSIDAGATRITVEVKAAGRALICVSDDGLGMDEEDARLSLQRHATSKLEAEEDLFNIRTMGFRGEALPSIASVSRLTLITAPRGKAEGVSLEVQDGEVQGVRAAATVGTRVEVRDLFYNTPARKKFMKRDSTEMVHIVDAVTRLALSHPALGFTLLSEGTAIMELPPARSIRERVAQVYGAEFLEELIETRAEAPGYGVEGFVSLPASVRDQRTHQLLFINGRPVKDASLSHAVYAAYEGYAPRERHPVFLLFLTLDPSEVDFNVHPAKREVRFAHKDSAYRIVKDAVREVVLGAKRPPEMDRSAGGYRDQAGLREAANSALPGQEGAFSPPRPAYTRYPSQGSGPSLEVMGVAESLSMSYMAEARSLYLGEMFVAYTTGDGLWLLDHHAAHERVLYEKLLGGGGGPQGGMRIESRMLLFPRQVKLSTSEHLFIREHADVLRGFGLEVEDFGHDTVIVRSLPLELEEADLRGVLAEAIAALREGDRPGKSAREDAAARIACHASIRGTRKLGPEELQSLLRQLEATQDPEHCPHGRPTRIRYTIEDLKKLFKRK